MERPAGAFFPEKMTSLEILDMSFIIFGVFSQYFGANLAVNGKKY